MEYIKKPMDIENGSMAIIESEMKNPKQFSLEQLAVTKRVIHTTADFEYEDLIVFSEGVVSKLKDSIRSKAKIYADTNMIAVAVNRVLLKKNQMEIVNYVHDEDVVIKARELSITRSMVAMEKAYLDKFIKVFLIGNAPTALIRLMELMDENPREDVVIVGVPVGFVGARESKEALVNTDHAHISITGRKGGSPVAAAIMNAVLKLSEEKV